MASGHKLSDPQKEIGTRGTLSPAVQPQPPSVQLRVSGHGSRTYDGQPPRRNLGMHHDGSSYILILTSFRHNLINYIKKNPKP